MPRRDYLADVVALLRKAESWSNGVPVSVIHRRAQGVVTLSKTLTAAEAARAAFAQFKVKTTLPAKWKERAAKVATFRADALPKLTLEILQAGVPDSFPVDSMPQAMNRAAGLWARNEGGRSPVALENACRAALRRAAQKQIVDSRWRGETFLISRAENVIQLREGGLLALRH